MTFSWTLLWWHWIVLGLLLIVAEMAAAGGFYIIFFGIGAVIVGVLSAFDSAGPPWLQVLLFTLLSVGGLALFRSRLLRLLQKDPQSPQIDTLVGEIGTVWEALPPGEVGKVELRGTSWSAKNSSTATLVSGARCRVVRVDGLMLHVKPEGAHS
jgi:membrane protein implicated in regulation of membrane protease activity